MLTVTEYKPGCYGSALTFKSGAAVCMACPYAQTCQVASQARMAMIREKFGVKPAAPKAEAKPVVERTPRPAISKASAAHIARIDAAKIKVRETLLNGENPFENKKPSFYHAFCHLLLNVPAGFSKTEAYGLFAKRLNWSHGVAVARVNEAVQVMNSFGTIIETDGKIKLNKAPLS